MTILERNRSQILEIKAFGIGDIVRELPSFISIVNFILKFFVGYWIFDEIIDNCAQ